MPATMVHYAYTHSNSFSQELVLGALSPVLKARAVLEQVVYRSYLKHTVRNITACLEDYFRGVDEMIRDLPKRRDDLSGPESTMYHLCIDAIMRFPHAELSTYDTLLSLPSENKLWSPTINRDFYIPYLTTIGCGTISEVISPIILLPHFELYERPLIDNTLNPTQGIRIQFSPITVASFKPKQVENHYANAEHFLATYLSNFRYLDWTLDHFIGILAAFCMEPGTYAMRKSSDYNRGVADICYEIVHPYRKIGMDTHPKVYHGDVYGVDRIIGLFRQLTENAQVTVSEDTSIFSEFLRKCNCYVQEVVSYFTKPLAEITAMESMAFHNSNLASFIPARFDANAENATEETPAEEDTPNDSTSDDTTADTETDMPSEEAPDISVDNSDEEPKEDKPKPPPKRDPAQMFIALASDDEKLSDYLYRRLVIERMSALIQNPPSSIPASEILLMRRYLTLWVHLLSVASIKDYVSRLSFQLMANERIKGTAYLK